MCNIPNSRLLPKTANNGDIMTFDAAQKKWVAATNVTGPGGSFDPTQDQNITGNYSFNKPIQIAQFGGSPDAPVNGYSIYSATNLIESRFFKSTGFRHHYDYSALSQNRTIVIPDSGGTMVTTTLLPGYLKLAAPLDGTLRNITDYAGTPSPINLSTGSVSITQANFSTYWNYGANGDEKFSFGGSGNWLIDRAGVSESALRIRRARGTLAALSSVLSGDTIMEFGADAYSSDNNYRRTFNMVVTATQNFSSNNIGSAVRFEKAKNGAGNRETVIGFDLNNYVGIGFRSISDSTYSAMLHLKGDGVNPIQKWDNLAGSNVSYLDNSGNLFANSFRSNNGYSRFEANNIINTFSDFSITHQGTNAGTLFAGSNFTRNLGVNIDKALSLNYVINNTGGTNTVTGFLVNAIETSLTGTIHNLMDLQIGGISRTTATSNRFLINYNTNYNTLFVGGAAAAGIKIGQGTDSTIEGILFGTNGSNGSFGSFGFGNSLIMTTSAFTFNKISLDSFVHKNLFIGGDNTTPSISARLQVRGDGINPIQKWDNNAGTTLATFTNGGLISFFNSGSGIDFYGQGIRFLDSLGTIDYSNGTSSSLAYHRFRSPSTAVTGNQKVIGIESNFSASAGGALFRPLSVEYTINNSGVQTGRATGIHLNATETALNGMPNSLIDLQRNGVSQLTFTSRGGVNPSLEIYGTTNPYIQITGSSAWFLQVSSGRATYWHSTNTHVFSGTGDTVIGFGGLTNLHPSLKRSLTEIQFMLADGSDNSPVGASMFKGYSDNTTRVGLLLDTNRLVGKGMYLSANYGISWMDSNDEISGNIDLGISRLSAGLLEVTDGGSGCGAIKACYLKTGDLSSGALNNAKPFRVGSLNAITASDFTTIGLDNQIAVELNGTVLYIPASSNQIS